MKRNPRNYSVEVYDLRMCTKERNLDRKNIKVNNSREIISCAGQMGLSFVIWLAHSSEPEGGCYIVVIGCWLLSALLEVIIAEVKYRWMHIDTSVKSLYISVRAVFKQFKFSRLLIVNFDSTDIYTQTLWEPCIKDMWPLDDTSIKSSCNMVTIL